MKSIFLHNLFLTSFFYPDKHTVIRYLSDIQFNKPLLYNEIDPPLQGLEPEHPLWLQTPPWQQLWAKVIRCPDLPCPLRALRPPRDLLPPPHPQLPCHRPR